MAGRFIRVTPPIAGPLVVGATQEIKWRFGKVKGDVKIQIKRGGGAFTTIATVPITPARYTWTVTGPADPNVIIRVESVRAYSGSKIRGDSTPFAINAAQSVTITAPADGSNVTAGQNLTVTYAAVNPPAGNVNIVLLRGGASTPLAPNVANTGTWTGLIPANYAPGAAQIEVSFVAAAAVRHTINVNVIVAPQRTIAGIPLPWVLAGGGVLAALVIGLLLWDLLGTRGGVGGGGTTPTPSPMYSGATNTPTPTSTATNVPNTPTSTSTPTNTPTVTNTPTNVPTNTATPLSRYTGGGTPIPGCATSNNYGNYEVRTEDHPRGPVTINPGEVGAIWWKVTYNGQKLGNPEGLWLLEPGTYDVSAEGRLRVWHVPAEAVPDLQVWWQCDADVNEHATFVWSVAHPSISMTRRITQTAVTLDRHGCPLTPADFVDQPENTQSPVVGPVVLRAGQVAMLWGSHVLHNGVDQGKKGYLLMTPGTYNLSVTDGRVRIYSLDGSSKAQFAAWVACFVGNDDPGMKGWNWVEVFPD